MEHTELKGCWMTTATTKTYDTVSKRSTHSTIMTAIPFTLIFDINIAHGSQWYFFLLIIWRMVHTSQNTKTNDNGGGDNEMVMWYSIHTQNRIKHLNYYWEKKIMENVQAHWMICQETVCESVEKGGFNDAASMCAAFINQMVPFHQFQ